MGEQWKDITIRRLVWETKLVKTYPTLAVLAAARHSVLYRTLLVSGVYAAVFSGRAVAGIWGWGGCESKWGLLWGRLVRPCLATAAATVCSHCQVWHAGILCYVSVTPEFIHMSHSIHTCCHCILACCPASQLPLTGQAAVLG